MARLRHHATTALLIVVGVLFAVAVGADVGRRVALQQRMRVDRHALRAYMGPQNVDPHRMDIIVHGLRDVVCVPSRGHHHRVRVCVDVFHTPTHGWRITGASRTLLGQRAAPGSGRRGRSGMGRRARPNTCCFGR